MLSCIDRTPFRPTCSLDFLPRVVQRVGPVDKDIEADAEGSFSTRGPPAERAKISVKCARGRAACPSRAGP